MKSLRLAEYRVRVTALLVGALWLQACDRGEPGALPPQEGPADIVVARVVESADIGSFPATVEAERRAEVATRVAGTVQRVPVDVGSRVGRGDPLVILDASDVQARISRAEAAVRQARQWYERIQSLESDGAATPQELDDAEARLAMAEATLSEAVAQLSYAVLRAPFAGVVTHRGVDPGDLATPGVPVVTLVTSEGAQGATRVVAYLPAALEGGLAVGGAAQVLDPATDRRYEATLTRVSPALEETSRRFRVEARLEPGPRLTPGAYVRLELPRPGAATRWMPADAVVRQGQLTGALVVENDTLRLRWIRLGETRGPGVEVLAGLPVGSEVVRRPSESLTDGREAGEVREEPFALVEGGR
jgi:RND family efflux transporter MFP subunit